MTEGNGRLAWIHCLLLPVQDVGDESGFTLLTSDSPCPRDILLVTIDR